MKNDLSERISGTLIKTANVIFAVVFSYIFLRVAVQTPSFIPGSVWKYLAAFLLWVVWLAAAYFAAGYLEKNQKSGKTALIFLILLQVAYVWAVHSQVDSDAYAINYIAYHYARDDFDALQGFWTQYLAVYTNNIPAAVLIRSVYAIWQPDTLESSWLLLSFIAAALSDLALYFIYKLINELLSRKAAVLAVAIAIPMISLSEPSTVLYTDIMALWATPAALYAIVRGVKKKQCRYFAGAGLLLAFGSWVKAQSAVLVIAVGIVLVLGCLRAYRKETFRIAVKRSLAFAGTFAAVMLCLSGISNQVIGLLGEDYVEQMEMPALHFVAMGLNEASGGAYSFDDVTDMNGALGQDAKKELCMEKISARLDSMGFWGLLEHLDGKLCEALGRGTFTSGREWRGVFLNEKFQAKRIRHWTVVDEPGFDNVTAVFIQTGYLMILLASLAGTAFAIVKVWQEKNELLMDMTGICRIAMIGIILMLCLLECNLRYMYAMLPCMILLSVYLLQKGMDKAGVCSHE